MNGPVRISVVIPAYNAAATIVASVGSVLAQTEPPFEVIVVDDASTDDTGTLLREQFGGRILYLRLARNSGPSAARNAGIRKATGDFIAFQDADDSWHPEKLRIIHQILSQRPDIRFLFHPFTHTPFPESGLSGYPAITSYPFRKLLLRNPIGTPCAVIRRHPGLRFDESMHHMEDYDLFLREACRAGVYRLPLPLTRLGRPVLTPGGQSSNRWRMRRGEWKAYAHLGRLNPLFYLALPFLIAFSLLKHAWKVIR